MLVATTVATAQLARFGYGSLDALTAATGGLLTEALTADELSDLTVRLFEASGKTDSPVTGLFAWEPEWYETHLPAAPARILVGAAGRGREVSALLARGYSVDAFEPVPHFCAACAARSGVGVTLSADYDCFTRAMLDGEPNVAGPLADAPYDAVVLGWGSLTHVLSPTDGERLLRAAHTAAPQGPILASFWARENDAPTLGRGRAAAAGRAAGRGFRRLRRLSGPPVEARLLWHAGFARTFSREEIEALGSVIGRDIAWEAEPYGHAVFVAPNDN
jgi:hypothetical protein